MTLRMDVTSRTAEAKVQMSAELARHIAATALGLEAKVKGYIQLRNLIDTGFMLSSVQATMNSRFEWTVAVAAEYAVYHEYGTVHQPARPFFHPAVEAMRPLWERGLKAL